MPVGSTDPRAFFPSSFLLHTGGIHTHSFNQPRDFLDDPLP